MVILETIAQKQEMPVGQVVTLAVLFVGIVLISIYKWKSKDCKNGEKSRYTAAAGQKKSN